MLVVTASVFEGPEPHVLFALTVISPPVFPTVVVIVVEVELPVHPVGKVHV